MDSDQTVHWNGPSACAWVEGQETLDRLWQPFADLLVDGVRLGAHVLDIGCGAGATTLAAARRAGAAGQCTGVDISEPLLTLARARAEREGVRATFLGADAGSCAFDPASFDRIISRFGVMFFDDPVEAFRNLRRAAKQDGELRFAVWRSPDENPFMTTAERAAAPLLPDLPARQPNEKGQFGFADRDRVFGILRDSGWKNVDMSPIDVACSLSEDELARYITRLGPVGKALESVDETTRAHVVRTVRPAFDAYVDRDRVRFTAACWMATARAN